MTKQFSQYNIDVSSSTGISIDTECPLVMAIYKLKLQYLDKFPEKFIVKITQDNQEKEWAVLNAFAEQFQYCDNLFFSCHATLPKVCYAGFNLVSDDQKTIYLFISRDATLPILVKGISSKINSVQLLSGTKIPYKQSNRLHSSAGVLWITPANTPLSSDLNIIRISLASQLKVYLGSGAPITQN